ncbi:MAG TPA: murein biosynthesis integral membrane protein MurJ [Candidatus Megaira endosymbiont of Hartmannula sinica]|nr:murein biosynthesis integral membrane protein MurJ [Candidatus Megaera endosymbiont of Hartmannula sinica]
MRLVKSGLLVMLMTFLSRIFGFFRDAFIASIFGTTIMADYINIALKLPNLFRRVFAEGAMSLVFIPFFNKFIKNSNYKLANIFSNSILTILITFLIIFIIILEILMPELMLIIAPGFYFHQDKNLIVLLCRITLPYLAFISIASLFGGVLNSMKNFTAFAFIPVLLNIAIIFFSLYFEYLFNQEQHKNISAILLSISFIMGGVLQLLFMYFAVSKYKIIPRIKLIYIKVIYLLFKRKQKTKNTNLNTEYYLDNNLRISNNIDGLIQSFIPATMTASVFQINIFISQSIASFFIGGVSTLSYADRIYQLPLSLIGITFSTILLPEISATVQKNDSSKIKKVINNSLIIGMLLAIPAMVGLISLADQIVYFIYKRGEFNINDVINTSDSLVLYSLGLPAFVISKIFTPIYYANLDSKTPFKITLYSIILNIVISIILVLIFGYKAIAFSCAATTYFTSYLLIKKASKYANFNLRKDIMRYIHKIIISSILMCIYIYSVKYYLLQEYLNIITNYNLINGLGFSNFILSLLFTIITAILLYISIIIALVGYRKFIQYMKKAVGK